MGASESSNEGVEDQQVAEQKKAIALARKLRPAWARVFEEIHNNSKHIFAKARQKLRNGMSERQLEEWVDDEIRKLSFLSQDLLLILWNKYDVNGDGEMSLEELTSLLSDYLLLAKEEIPEEIVGALQQQFKNSGMSSVEIEQYLQNPAVSEQMNSIKSTIRQQFEAWLAQVHKHAVKMHKKLDVSGDGIVTKEEFMIKFPEICDEVCNLGGAKKIVFRLDILNLQPAAFERGGKHDIDADVRALLKVL